MAQIAEGELVDRFGQFYRNYYREEIGELAGNYPSEQRSLHVDWSDLYQFDADLADDYLSKPEQLREYAEEALRLYDLPVDVSLGQAHVRIRNLPEITDIREIRSPDVNTLVAVQGIVRKATDVRPKIEEAAFECQRCGTLSYIPQSGGFQEPHECQGCERQGPFSINYDQSTFVDAQKLRVQERPEGLRGGETPQSIDVDLEDDLTGEVAPGDYVTVAGVLRIEQQSSNNEKTRMFDVYMDGHSLVMEDEEFEEMDISEADKQTIIELAGQDDVYERMVGSIAPSIYGYEEEKLAIAMQLFSGVTKHLPDESRIRGDLHILLIGDPGTGKCIKSDSKVELADGSKEEIGRLVESNLEDPKPVDDGVWDTADFRLPSLTDEGTFEGRRVRRVWKREAPERMYQIRTGDGSEVEITPSHPLYVKEGGSFERRRAKELREGQIIAARNDGIESGARSETGGGQVLEPRVVETHDQATITSIETVDPDYDWVYDLEVEGTHNYLSNGIVSHNSQLLQYIQHIAPRSVYTSGKGSSAAGLTAAAVQSDFGEGQAWTLEAGALVLADKGTAAVDELDKMAPDDRSAMHEALEQQEISISKAGITATLKSRCALLAAANPKYGRFDEYELIAEQIELDPALISRFDLIFTVTDQPDEEDDRRLAEHIIQSNYAGELDAQTEALASPDVDAEEVAEAARDVEPTIDAELLRKYVAYAKRDVFPTMTEAARDRIREFYVDMRSHGTGEDAPVPITARKLEALVRLAEASARVRLSDTVEEEDAERVIEIVRSSLRDVGMDPETGEFDADIVETEMSKSQRDRVKNLKTLIEEIEDEYEEGAPVEEVIDRADELGMDDSKADHEIEKLKQKGELYEPQQGYLRTT